MAGEVEKLFVSWAEFGELERRLTEKVESKYHSIDVIVGIARGGMPSAISLSNWFNLPLDFIRTRSYNGINERGTPELLSGLHYDINDKTVLLVDDISDSGDVLRFAINYIEKEFRPKNVYTATLFIKQGTGFKPDVYLEETDKWVVFPWEQAPNVK